MKKKASKLWSHRKDMKGGKYLVLRRDNTVLPGPHFVLGPRDPCSPVALRAYADEAKRLGYAAIYVESVREHAEMQEYYREHHGTGDPDRGPHRKDNQAIIKRMVEEGDGA